jgi:hypothetical protein
LLHAVKEGHLDHELHEGFAEGPEAGTIVVLGSQERANMNEDTYIMEYCSGEGADWGMISGDGFFCKIKPLRTTEKTLGARRFTLEQAADFIREHQLKFVRLTKANHLPVWT